MKRLFLGLTLILSLTLFLPNVHAAVLSGWGTATIDGVINTAEWANADTLPFSVLAGTYTGTIYFMNDATNLYIGVIVNGDDEISVTDAFTVRFDNDNGGEATLEVGDDYLALNGISFFGDFFYNGATLFLDTTDPPGTTDGSGSASRVGSANHFEMSHPLNSGDIGHDFALSAGQLVGFTLAVNIDNIGYDLFGDLPGVPSSWLNDYQVASEPFTGPPSIPRSSSAVGGIMLPSSNLAILSPYVTLAALVCLALIVLKKRS